MLSKRFYIFFLTLLLISCSQSESQKGHLIIIGGGSRPDNIMEKIVQLAGGEKAKIVIVPSASSHPLKTALYQKKQFESHNPETVDYILSANNIVDSDSNLEKLDDATGIFFSGGDQRRLSKLLLGTELLDKIKSIYDNGGVIGGTSAGAAVMSKIMITGDELINQDSTYSFISIQKENIDTKEGFGFITNAIIDQHFVKRKRYNRLISLVLENPDHVGIGIDESTAIWVKPDNTFEVLGESSVIILDATHSKNIRSNKDLYMSGENIVMHVMLSGQKFDLKTNSIIK